MELRDATKSYGAVRALRDGNLALRSGEVRALMGENGAGKSTLVKVLGGVIRRDAGEMLVDGEPVDFHSPHDARDAGIAVIYQEPTLFPDLSVAENVVMGYHPLGAFGRIDRRAMHRQVQELMDRLGVRLDPERPVRGLSIADQQIVEIAKALCFDARVLIMDEPTAALSGPEVERLFTVVRTLREHGAGGAVHLAPARRGVRPLRHGHRDARRRRRARRADRRHDARRDGPADGRARAEHALPQAGHARSARPCCSVQRLTREGVFFDVGFEVRAGEIVALAGLVGAGRSEVARAIFGVDRPDAGTVEVDGPAPAAGPPGRGHARRGRLRAGGPAPAGPRAGPLDRAQHRADPAARAARGSA